MNALADHNWKLKYTPDDGDLVRLFYVPALKCAARYDRLTGFFDARALALAARGLEGLIMNGGYMRLVVGCTLHEAEVAAIEKGESLKRAVERRMLADPLLAVNRQIIDALELLAWMVAHNHLEVKVSIPCDQDRKPIVVDGIFHEKAGIIVDGRGDRLAFNGSLNETEAGWQRNWESLNAFTSWHETERVDEEESNFAKIWAGKALRVITLDVPSAVRDNLLQFLPKEDKPARLKTFEADSTESGIGTDAAHPKIAEIPPTDLRRLVWGFIKTAPKFANGGQRVGEATAAVDPWPHQVRAFERMYRNWPPKLLIADEVGLGKTIEAGMLLRQAWLAERARRILILAPKAVCRQWQVELYEKFNLNWPIYDGNKFILYPSPSIKGRNERPASRSEWFNEPAVIVSSQMVRREDRAADLLAGAQDWDLIVLDEAHHARRRAPGAPTEGGPNRILRLMQRLKERTLGLVLLTATPMQVHPVEIWDLMNLFGLPQEWDASSFVRFFSEIEEPSPSAEAFEDLARMFSSAEKAYGEVPVEEVIRLGGIGRLKAKKILNALRDPATVPRRQLETTERKLALRLMKRNTPVKHFVSRATRELLRTYYQQGRISMRIAERKVVDRFIELSTDQTQLYEAVEDYISETYKRASDRERSAIGFVMTIYRRRLASSFAALRETLEDHLDVIKGAKHLPSEMEAQDDIPDDPANEDIPDVDEVAAREREGLLAQESAEIETLLAAIRRLPPDTKIEELKKVLGELRGAGYQQVMVFTQYTDTMDFLRGELVRRGSLRVMCFSGRGGEIRDADGRWRVVSRDDIKRRFREGQADVLLCSDAAAEGLNFQFCGALVNYDLPWNPMKVEQRIGRIDRLGQRYDEAQIVNLLYSDTVETDIYIALRNRIKLFENVVGRLQPILSQVPTLIAESVLSGTARDPAERRDLIARLESQAQLAQTRGFDLDDAIETDLVEPEVPTAPLTMDDLDLVISTPAALPPGIEVKPLGNREYSYLAPGMKEPLRVSTDVAFYEEHSDSVELWSPGSSVFPTPDFPADAAECNESRSISDLLSRKDASH